MRMNNFKSILLLLFLTITVVGISQKPKRPECEFIRQIVQDSLYKNETFKLSTQTLTVKDMFLPIIYYELFSKLNYSTDTVDLIFDKFYYTENITKTKIHCRVCNFKSNKRKNKLNLAISNSFAYKDLNLIYITIRSSSHIDQRIILFTKKDNKLKIVSMILL